MISPDVDLSLELGEYARVGFKMQKALVASMGHNVLRFLLAKPRNACLKQLTATLAHASPFSVTDESVEWLARTMITQDTFLLLEPK